MSWRSLRLASCLLGIAGALVLAGVALGKEGARARLATRPRLDARAGTTIRIAWEVDVADGHGGREPFGAGGMFVRLLSRTGAPSTLGFDGSHGRPGGRYLATVTVPAGGVGGVRVGLRGTRCDVSGCRPSDLIFPLENDPFTSPGGARCDVAALARTLRAFARAYNGGEVRQLDRLFSHERFVSYSSGRPGIRRLDHARNRETLSSYFRRRHRRGDRFSAITFRFNGYERQRALGHFELSGRRRAADFRRGRWFNVLGKGALDCSKPPVTIAVMSIG